MTYHYVPVLTIAGSDSSGGAGIQADIKTISALGGYAAAVITAITAQNTMGVTAIEAVTPDMIRAQIAAVMDDIKPRSVKIGMTGSRGNVEAIRQSLRRFPSVPLVIDPVMVSTSGCTLADRGATDLTKEWLVPMATLLTPNIPEAEQLTGLTIRTEENRREAASIMLDMGCGAVLIKGGHAPQGNTVTDWMYHRTTDGTMAERVFSHPLIDTRNTHGTGCTLSSAIATHLAMGHPLDTSVELSVRFLYQALCSGRNVAIGKGHGPVNHHFEPQPLRIIEDTAVPPLTYND